MSFQIRYQAKKRIVYVAFFGVATMENRIEASRQLAEKYGHLRPLRILADVRKSIMGMSLEEQQELGKIVAELHGLRNARAAVLHAPGFNMNTVVNVAAQVGGMELAEFITESAAESWLLRDSPVIG